MFSGYKHLKDQRLTFHLISFPILPAIVLRRKRCQVGTFVAVHWLWLCLPVEGVWVRSLIWEVRSPQAQRPKKQYIKQKQFCNKHNKDFKKEKKKRAECQVDDWQIEFLKGIQRLLLEDFTYTLDHIGSLHTTTLATHCTTLEDTLHKDYNMKEPARTKSHLPLAIPNQNHFACPLQHSLA